MDRILWRIFGPPTRTRNPKNKTAVVTVCAFNSDDSATSTKVGCVSGVFVVWRPHGFVCFPLVSSARRRSCPLRYAFLQLKSALKSRSVSLAERFFQKIVNALFSSLIYFSKYDRLTGPLSIGRKNGNFHRRTVD